MKKGKVQTNNIGVNVLVQHEDVTSRHYSHLDFDVMCEKMTEDDIDTAFSKIVLSIDDKKNFLKKIKGYAISNVSNYNDIKLSDLFSYKTPKK